MFCPTQTANGTDVDVFKWLAFNHIGCICNLSVTIASLRHGLEGVDMERRMTISSLCDRPWTSDMPVLGLGDA